MEMDALTEEELQSILNKKRLEREKSEALQKIVEHKKPLPSFWSSSQEEEQEEEEENVERSDKNNKELKEKGRSDVVDDDESDDDDDDTSIESGRLLLVDKPSASPLLVSTATLQTPTKTTTSVDSPMKSLMIVTKESKRDEEKKTKVDMIMNMVLKGPNVGLLKQLRDARLAVTSTFHSDPIDHHSETVEKLLIAYDELEAKRMARRQYAAGIAMDQRSKSFKPNDMIKDASSDEEEDGEEDNDGDFTVKRSRKKDKNEKKSNKKKRSFEKVQSIDVSSDSDDETDGIDKGVEEVNGVMKIKKPKAKRRSRRTNEIDDVQFTVEDVVHMLKKQYYDIKSMAVDLGRMKHQTKLLIKTLE